MNSKSEPIHSAAFPASVGVVKRKSLKQLPLEIRQGSLPCDLQGHAFFVGPGGFVDTPECSATGFINPSHDGTPLFNGDPLIYRLDLGPDRVLISSEIPSTPCLDTDRACQIDPIWHSYRYGNYGLARLSFRLGFRNEVNTAVVPVRFSDAEGYRLLLTWDAGRPFEIDPLSLQIATAVGHDSEWKEQIELPVPFGIVTTPAHPAFKPASTDEKNDAKLFTVNYGKSIGTALHPIIHRYVDAPITKTEEELIRTLHQLIGLSESLLAALQSLLKILRWLEARMHASLTNAGKRTTAFLMKSMHHLLRAPAHGTRQFGHLDIASEISGLIEVMIRRETALTNNQDDHFEKTLDHFLSLLDVLKKLTANADKMEDFVHLIAWDGQQVPMKQWKVYVEGEQPCSPPRIMQSMHQLGVTEHHVILMDTVFKLGAEQLLTAPAPNFPELERIIRNLTDYRQGDETRIYIIKRTDLDDNKDSVTAKLIRIPRPMAHFLVDYECTPDKITLHCVQNTGWDAAEWVRPYDQFPLGNDAGMVGMASGGTDLSVLARCTINVAKGECEDIQIVNDQNRNVSWMLALYALCMPDGITPPKRIDYLFWNGWGSHANLLTDYDLSVNQAAKNRQLNASDAVRLAEQGLPCTLLRLNTQSMTIEDHYSFPSGRFGNSVQFIPRAGAEPGSADGYLLCITNGSDDPEQSEFWLFDAQDLAKGPICRMGHSSLKIGLTIHSTWVPSIQERTASYKVSIRDDYKERLHRINRLEELEPLFNTYVDGYSQNSEA